MMPEQLPDVIGGVDTHGEFHVAAVIDAATGRTIGAERFGASPAGYRELHRWLGAAGRIISVGVEGTGAFGAGLCRHLVASGVQVVEVDRPNRQARYRNGKDDTLDAVEAARAVLSGRATGRPKTGTGHAEAIRVVELTCHSATKDRTRAINQFKAALVTAPESLRASMTKLGFAAQLKRARRFRDFGDDIVERNTRVALKHLAQRIQFLDGQITDLEQRMIELAAQTAPALLGLAGVGPHVAAQILAAVGDNPERIQSEAAFAKICGACPIPASSGNIERHRLNRGGDRRANNALHTIVLVRMRHDPRTRAYVERRTSEGKTRKEIIRCLKRFVAREIYQILTDPPAEIPTGAELRRQRNQLGWPLTKVAYELGTEPIRISRLERQLDYNNDLATRMHDLIKDAS